MHSATEIILFSLLGCIHAKEQLQNHTSDVQEKSVDKAINNLFDRALRALPIDHKEWDKTTAGKPGHLSTVAHTRPGPLPALPHSNPGDLSSRGIDHQPQFQWQGLPDQHMKASVVGQFSGQLPLHTGRQVMPQGPISGSRGNSGTLAFRQQRKEKWEVRSSKPDAVWPQASAKFHRWITEEENDRLQAEAYVIKTPERFLGTRAKGGYPRSTRVQFTLPGKEDEQKTIEFLWSNAEDNPSFGAVKVKLPLDAKIYSKNSRLVVKQVEQGSHAKHSNIRQGDIIRAVSVPDTENQQDSPWWAKLNQILVPDAEQGMVILDGKSAAQFNAALEENLRVDGKQAEVVLLIERPVKRYNDDDGESFLPGLPSWDNQGYEQKLAPQLVPIPIPVEDDKPGFPRYPPPSQRFDSFTVQAPVQAPQLPSTGGLDQHRDAGYPTNIRHVVQRLRKDHQHIPNIAPGLDLAGPEIRMNPAQITGIFKGSSQYARFWRFFRIAVQIVETVSSESRSEVVSITHTGSSVQIKWRLLFVPRAISQAATAFAAAAAAAAVSAATGHDDTAMTAASVAAAASTVTSGKGSTGDEKGVDFTSIYELDASNGQIISHTLEFSKPLDNYGLLETLQSTLNVGKMVQPAMFPAF